MPYYDPLVDFSLIQRKPGVGIKKPELGIMPTPTGYEVVLWEGDILHSQMFCYNPSCPCHESRLLIEQVARFVREGLMTPQEATNYVSGRTLTELLRGKA